MNESRRRSWFWFLGIPATILLIALAAVLVFQLRSGIQVTVTSTGNTPLKSVVLHVTGATYKLGDLAPGDSATTGVNLNGESHLEVEFSDAKGRTQRVNAGGYFESGYRGTIRVEIKDGKIDKFQEDVKLW